MKNHLTSILTVFVLFVLVLNTGNLHAQKNDLPEFETKEINLSGEKITEIKSGTGNIFLEADFDLVNKNGIYLSRLELSDDGYIELKIQNPGRHPQLRLKISFSQTGFSKSDFKEMITVPVIEEADWVDIIFKPDVEKHNNIFLKWELITDEDTQGPTVGLTGLDEHFLKYEIFNFSDFKIGKSGNESIMLRTGSKIFHLELEEVNLLSEDFRVILYDGIEAKIKNDIVLPKTYSGYNLTTGGNARITIADNFIYGFIEDDKETFYIEPASYFESDRSGNQMVIYSSADAASTKDATCGVKHSIEADNHRHHHLLDDFEAHTTANCQIIDYAAAFDFSMFNHYGSEINVINWKLGVMNNVQSNYIDQLHKNYIFQIKEFFIVTQSGTDPWTNSTNPETLLNSFSDWAGSGFSVIHDIGTLWSRRDFDGSTVGLAWVGAVCWNNYKYNINEDYSTNAQNIRVLLAHEMGHNFGASHDASGAPYIMAPSVNPNNVNFSTATYNAVQSYMNTQSCAANCPADQLPVCGGWFYDSGGADESYGNNQDIVTTICPENPGHVVDILFSFFKTESGDVLTCHNGNNTSAPVIWSHSGLNLPPVNPVLGINPTGCLTFRFTSNSSGTNQGWAASISCYEESTCPRPVDLTHLVVDNESVQVDWTETGYATSWQIELGNLGFTPTGIPTHTAPDKPYTLTNLSPDHQYSYYVRADCSPETSEWAGPYDFTTPPGLCSGNTQNGSSAIPADGSVVTNPNVNTGQYTRFTGVNTGGLYNFQSSVSTDWLVVTNESNTLLAQGTSPVSWTATITGNVRVHIFTNIFCGTNAALRNISASCVSCIPPGPNCTTYNLPADGEVDVMRPVLFFWNHPSSGPVPTHYDLYLGSTPNSYFQVFTISYPSNGIYINGFPPNATYYWRIIPRNADGEADNCEVWSFTTMGVPPNDECANAITLSEGSEPIPGTTVGGTQSYSACVGNSNDDVFYKFTTNASGGPFTITVQPVLGSFNPVAELLSSCGGASLVCQNANGNGGTEIITYTGAGSTTYHVRVHSFTTDGSSRFTIKVEGAVLPIEIISLKAYEQGRNNIIEWVTANEVNNEFQIVEKQDNVSADWVEIGRVSGTNLENTEKQYRITDFNPSQVEYYRIRSVDFDGSFQYSKIISLIRSNTSTESKVVSIYPNPADNILTIDITSEIADEVDIRIMDLTGKVILLQNHSMNKGENKVMLDLKALPSGTYFAYLTGNKLNAVEKIIKQ